MEGPDNGQEPRNAMLSMAFRLQSVRVVLQWTLVGGTNKHVGPRSSGLSPLKDTATQVLLSETLQAAVSSSTRALDTRQREVGTIRPREDGTMRPEVQLLLWAASPNGQSRELTRAQVLLDQDLDWEYILGIGLRNGILPLLYWHLNSLCAAASPGGPAEAKGFFRQTSFASSTHQRARSTRRTTKLDQGPSVRTIVSCGVALAAILPAVYMRSRYSRRERDSHDEGGARRRQCRLDMTSGRKSDH